MCRLKHSIAHHSCYPEDEHKFSPGNVQNFESENIWDDGEFIDVVHESGTTIWEDIQRSPVDESSSWDELIDVDSTSTTGIWEGEDLLTDSVEIVNESGTSIWEDLQTPQHCESSNRDTLSDAGSNTKANATRVESLIASKVTSQRRRFTRKRKDKYLRMDKYNSHRIGKFDLFVIVEGDEEK